MIKYIFFLFFLFFISSILLSLFFKDYFSFKKNFCKQDLYVNKSFAFQIFQERINSFYFCLESIDNITGIDSNNIKLSINGKKVDNRNFIYENYLKLGDINNKGNRILGRIINKNILVGDIIDIEFNIYSDFLKKPIKKDLQIVILDDKLNFFYYLKK